jgi:hypothetical protein
MHYWHGVRRSLLPVLIALAMPVLAADGGDDRIAAHLRSDGTRIEQPRVIVWYRPSAMSAETANAFAERLSSGVEEIEAVAGTHFDRSYFGQEKIECFVSPRAGMSHAYIGKKPYFFVTPERINEHDVPYRHELTHIIAWWSCGKGSGCRKDLLTT